MWCLEEDPEGGGSTFVDGGGVAVEEEAWRQADEDSKAAFFEFSATFSDEGGGG
jgi:hypothetical protein